MYLLITGNCTYFYGAIWLNTVNIYVNGKNIHPTIKTIVEVEHISFSVSPHWFEVEWPNISCVLAQCCRNLLTWGLLGTIRL